jgi:hypothetical protein
LDELKVEILDKIGSLVTQLNALMPATKTIVKAAVKADVTAFKSVLHKHLSLTGGGAKMMKRSYK